MERLFIYLIVLIIWIIYWFHERNKWPKTENGKVGIVFCIDTENNKQKIRIKSDLVERMEKLVEANSLSDQIDILLIKPNKTDKFLKIIRNYNKKRNQLIRNGLNISNEKEIKIWNKTLNRINGHFFIWGEIKERKNNESRYYFELDSLVTHKPLTFSSQAFLKTEMMNIWAKGISFKEQFEFDGFKLSTDIIYLAVKYITGIAAFLSGDPFLAVKLHHNLENEINNFKNIPKNLESVKKKLKLLISEEYVIIGRTYNQTNNFELAKQSLAKAIKVNKDGYAVNLFKSIIDFQDGNPNESLKSIRIAKNSAGHDGTWRYNEGFILMFLEKWPEAMKTYNKISETSYFNEEDTLDQVLNFIKIKLKIIQSICKVFLS